MLEQFNNFTFIHQYFQFDDRRIEDPEGYPEGMQYDNISNSMLILYFFFRSLQINMLEQFNNFTFIHQYFQLDDRRIEDPEGYPEGMQYDNISNSMLILYFFFRSL
jgi:hypothetical protein